MGRFYFLSATKEAAGEGRALHCHIDGERIIKSFLLNGMSRLELSAMTPPIMLTYCAEIAAWLERHIPERQTKASRPRQVPQPQKGSK